MSITLKNLESALAGESMAHIKYRYFAKIAREEGFEEVAQAIQEFSGAARPALTKRSLQPQFALALFVRDAVAADFCKA